MKTARVLLADDHAWCVRAFARLEKMSGIGVVAEAEDGYASKAVSDAYAALTSFGGQQNQRTKCLFWPAIVKK
jgi:hypothetical protein